MGNKKLRLHKTKYTARLLIKNENDEYLFLKRKSKKKYELPGGQVDKKDCENPKHPTIDDFLNAAIREAKEEVGDILFEIPGNLTNIKYKRKNGKSKTEYFFETKLISGTAKINEPNNFKKIKWISEGDLFYGKRKISINTKIALEKKIRRYQTA